MRHQNFNNRITNNYKISITVAILHSPISSDNGIDDRKKKMLNKNLTNLT